MSRQEVIAQTSYISYDPKTFYGNRTFSGLEQQQELLLKLKSSDNISQFLYYISRLKNIQLTRYQQKHFDLKASCDRGWNYRICDCPSCSTRHFIKTSCNSFFCEECRKFNVFKVKRKAKEYLWNCNHYYATFTLPPEIQSKVESWNKFLGKRYYKDKAGDIRSSELYVTDLVYKSVSGAIKEYCKKYNLENGFILMPHSYGSLALNWNFHINALISSKAFKKPDLRNNKINKIFSDEKNRYHKGYLDHLQLSYEKGMKLGTGLRYVLNNIKQIRQDYLDKIKNKSYTVDYQFNYNELRSIYEKHLRRNFKTDFKDTPQVKFAEKKVGRKKTIYIPYKKAVSVVLDYFKHIPLSIKNIVKVESGRVYYQTSKAKGVNITYDKSLREFFELVMQHIPPARFRTVRQYGLYSNKTKKRKTYLTSQSKKAKSMRCDSCKIELKKENFVGMVHCGLLVWINPVKRSIFNCKDFVDGFIPEIDTNGRVMQVCEPPDCLKPKTRPEFPKKEEKDFSEDFNQMENLQW